MSIQNFFTSRENNANAETYVGQQGRLWHDSATNTIYVSDGTTPGGIPIQSSVTATSVVRNAAVTADSNTPTVITDMSLTLAAGRYLLLFNSEYADTVSIVTATAAADLARLYDYLTELPATVTDHAAAYGSGETLGPGVYTQAAASSIAGTLTLDAAGDPDALFVFRSAGALTTGAATEIVLINGAVSNNVWWVAEGAISTSANSIIRGSLLTNQAAASTGAGTQVEGRMLAINGAVAVGDTSIFTAPTGTSTAPVGTVSLFSIFAATGAVSNTGASVIALSVGTDSGSITGFETATVGGTIYPGGVSALAVISFGMYVDGVLVTDTLRSQVQLRDRVGRPMTLQTVITLTSTQTVDVRTQVPIGEFTIGPGMSFVALDLFSASSGGGGETYTGDGTTINVNSENVISVVNLPNEIIGPVQGIEFDTSHVHDNKDPGTLCWNPDDDTLNIQHTGEVVQQVGQELFARVTNASGTTIAKGTVVRFSGVSSDRLEVAPFQADGTAPSLYTLGVTTQSIANGAQGLITTWGAVRAIDTTGGAENWQVGQILYASPDTAGGYTKIKPTAPDNVVPVAAVLIVSATEGEIFVRPTIEQDYSYGEFGRTTDVPVATINTADVVTFDSEPNSNGVTRGDPTSRLIVSQSGFYQIDINAQVVIAGNKNVVGTMYIWLRKNGVDVVGSMRRQGQSGLIPNLTFSYTKSLSLAANDYIEIAYAADDIDMRFDADVATAFGPSTAAVLVGVTQVQL